MRFRAFCAGLYTAYQAGTESAICPQRPKQPLSGVADDIAGPTNKDSKTITQTANSLWPRVPCTLVCQHLPLPDVDQIKLHSFGDHGHVVGNRGFRVPSARYVGIMFVVIWSATLHAVHARFIK